jgi:hypothetical protein
MIAEQSRDELLARVNDLLNRCGTDDATALIRALETRVMETWQVEAARLFYRNVREHHGGDHEDGQPGCDVCDAVEAWEGGLGGKDLSLNRRADRLEELLRDVISDLRQCDDVMRHNSARAAQVREARADERLRELEAIE